MANISSYLEEKILDHVFNNIPYTSPNAVYVGLVNETAVDSDLEGGDLTNEVTSYTGDRKQASFSNPVQESGKGMVEITADIDFEEMPADTIEYAVIMDTQTLIQSITDESFTSNFDTTVDLANNNLVSGSVVVTTTDGTTTYSEETDYSIDYINGTITVLSGGAMSDATSYHIDYDHIDGNILVWCPASSIKTTNAGDTYRIPAQDLTFTLD